MKNLFLDFWKDIKEHFGITPIKGIHNSITFSNKKISENYGVIILSKRLTKGGKSEVYGNLVFDNELYNIFNL